MKIQSTQREIEVIQEKLKLELIGLTICLRITMKYFLMNFIIRLII